MLIKNILKIISFKYELRIVSLPQLIRKGGGTRPNETLATQKSWVLIPTKI